MNPYPANVENMVSS